MLKVITDKPIKPIEARRTWQQEADWLQMESSAGRWWGISAYEPSPRLASRIRNGDIEAFTSWMGRFESVARENPPRQDGQPSGWSVYARFIPF